MYSCIIIFTSSLRATNKADKFSAWAKWASNLSSSDDNTQNRISESAIRESEMKTQYCKAEMS